MAKLSWFVYGALGTEHGPQAAMVVLCYLCSFQGGYLVVWALKEHHADREREVAQLYLTCYMSQK
eukprot:scaffold65179_cov19-Tisochrysis_lutea.AAC.1